MQVGRVRLYLLDSNDAANLPIHRGITSELYGGNSELRCEKWPSVRFGQVTVEPRDNQHFFTIEVYLHGLNPNAVRVDLFANQRGGDAAVRQEMERVGPLVEDPTGDKYVGAVPASRPLSDYTARVIPSCPGVSIPMEAEQILWQR